MNRRQAVILFVAIALVFLFIGARILPPTRFPSGRTVLVPAGSSVQAIGRLLAAERVIASPRLFANFVRQRGLDARLQAGLYEFERPLSLFQIIERLSQGLYVKEPVLLTVPEGLMLEQLVKLAAEHLPAIKAEEFLAAAAPEAGFLFPDTYSLPPHLSASQLVVLMRDNFDRRTGELKSQIEQFGRTLEEVVSMAALVEEEASRETDRRIIAGILWKRLDNERRLEVDVATSTYQTLGLPPEPIVSTGLSAIKAVLNPEATPYWFYLSDKDGKTYYAKTFAEHKLNIDKYLK
jgi:UPF0755 protein